MYLKDFDQVTPESIFYCRHWLIDLSSSTNSSNDGEMLNQRQDYLRENMKIHDQNCA
jgi:hypothetical protein